MSSITNISSCTTGNFGHRVFVVNKKNHLAVLNIADPRTATSLSPTEINVGGDVVEADPTNNIGAIAWMQGKHWEVRIYFATRSKVLKELTWNSNDNVYTFGKLHEKEYEVLSNSTITAESQDAVMYVYCNLKKYSNDYNVVFQDGSGWNDHKMS